MMQNTAANTCQPTLTTSPPPSNHGNERVATDASIPAAEPTEMSSDDWLVKMATARLLNAPSHINNIHSTHTHTYHQHTLNTHTHTHIYTHRLHSSSTISRSHTRECLLVVTDDVRVPVMLHDNTLPSV